MTYLNLIGNEIFLSEYLLGRADWLSRRLGLLYLACRGFLWIELKLNFISNNLTLSECKMNVENKRLWWNFQRIVELCHELVYMLVHVCVVVYAICVCTPVPNEPASTILNSCRSVHTFLELQTCSSDCHSCSTYTYILTRLQRKAIKIEKWSNKKKWSEVYSDILYSDFLHQNIFGGFS